MSSDTKSLRRDNGRKSKWLVLTIWLEVILLLAAVALVFGAGLAYRREWVDLSVAFVMLRQGVQLAISAGMLGLVTLLIAGIDRRWRPARASALVCLAVLAIIAMPMQMKQRAQSVPPIHDITTDMTNPPPFKALASAREAAPNEVNYPGEETARQQQAAYPMIKPIVIDLPMNKVLNAAEAAVGEQGWKVAAVTANTIEATATTRWFGFKDDVVIRLTETDDGVRVDMRSASRLGKSDVGTNAARIQSFLAELENQMP